MVNVDDSSLPADSRPKSFGLIRGGQPLGAVRHLSDKPSDLYNSRSDFLMTESINVVLGLSTSISLPPPSRPCFTQVKLLIGS